MKRIGAFSLALIVFALSIIVYLPDITFADDSDKTYLSFTFKQLNNSVGAGMSASDASAVVTAHKDIYTSDGKLLFIYNPSKNYNWTTSTEAYYITLNYSDEQLKNIFMSKNPLSTIFNVWGAGLSNNNGIRAFCAGLGTIFSGNSDMGTKVLDTISGNYNYLDSLKFDEGSQTITMSNDNGSVDKLREEIKKYYYDYIGMCEIKPSGTVKQYVDSSDFHKLFEYDEDYLSAIAGFSKSKYVLRDKYYFAYFYDDSDYMYMSDKDGDRYSWYYDGWYPTFCALYKFNNASPVYFTLPIDKKGLFLDFSRSDKPIDDISRCKFCMRSNYQQISLLYAPCFYGDGKLDNISTIYFYSADGTPFTFFKSLSALYNYLNGDQTAYLTSQVQKTGEDITLSIKDMNENLGTKMDELIDNLNSNKSNMSRDELQDAIDKGVADISKNTEDIKDNTSDIVNLLKEQNKILLDILGVTEYIAYQKTKDDGSSYTKTDVVNTLNKIYNGFGNAILYGKNTLTDSGDSSAAAAQSYIVTREDFKLSNNIYSSSGSGFSPGTPVVAYSLDDSPVYDDSNDYDVGIASQDINNMDIHDGIFGKFPFSVPYQLYEWLQVLQADPVAPKLVYNYGFLLGHKNEPKYDLIIDFNIYEPWANVCKSFLRLSFTLLMAVFIFRHFSNNKGGGVL